MVAFLFFLLLAIVFQTSSGFQMGNRWIQVRLSNTQLFEDFNLNFRQPNIVSSKELVTEEQYRGFIRTYSNDERFSILDFILGFFKKGDNKEASSSSSAPARASKSVPSYAKSLKPTVSIEVLQEKTAAFVQGKVDAKAFYAVLKGAFGDKLSKDLPEIIASLPKEQAEALRKVAK